MCKVFFVLALCLFVLPAMQARSLTEEELLETTRLLLQNPEIEGTAASGEELNLVEGFYGQSAIGGYGGELENPAPLDVLESAPAGPGATMTPPTVSATATTPAADASAKTAVKSGAFSATVSSAVVMAGVMVAASALML